MFVIIFFELAIFLEVKKKKIAQEQQKKNRKRNKQKRSVQKKIPIFFFFSHHHLKMVRAINLFLSYFIPNHCSLDCVPGSFGFPPSCEIVSELPKYIQWRLHNCGNTTEATTLQQFINFLKNK